MEKEGEQLSQDFDLLEETRQSSNTGITMEQDANPTEIPNEIKRFLSRCFLQSGILLEAMIARVLLTDTNGGDIFECGVAKAAHLSEYGDVQSVISVLAQWSSKLRTKRGTSSTEGGINKQLLKRFDERLYCCYDEVRCMFPDIETTSFSFHSDVSYVHRTMTEIMATVWPQRLCVYKGHNCSVGYVEISSNSSIAVGKRSCFRLMNRPPKFALYLDNISDSVSPKEAQIWVAVVDSLAAVILEKFFYTTTAEIIEKHQLRTVTLENIGFELGYLAMQDNNLGDRLRLISGKMVTVFYDSDFKRLVIAYAGQIPNLSRDLLDNELESLRMELAAGEWELPFPDTQSLIRLQIGEGFKCSGVAGFLRSPDEKLSAMCSNECANISMIPFVTERMLLREEEIDRNKNNREILILTPETVTQDGNPRSASNTGVHYHNDVMLNLIYQANARNESAKHDLKDSSYCNITWRATRAVLELFAGEFKTDSKHGIDLIVGTEILEGSRVRLGICFPNLRQAKAGLLRLKTCQFVSLENADQLDRSLKTFSVSLKSDLYQLFEKQIRFHLEQFRLEKTAENYDISDETPSPTNGRPNYREIRIQVGFSETKHLNKINDYFTTLLEPVRIKINNSKEAFRLKGQAGKQFLQFLQDFTETYIHISNHQQVLYIYGTRAKRDRAVNILRKQITNHTGEVRWHLVDLGNMEFVSNSVKIWYDEFWPKTVAILGNNVIQRCVLLKYRPELWIETTAESFELYYDSVKSRLTGVDKKVFSLDIATEQATCSVCFDRFAVTDERCYILSICGHVYCTGCMLQMVSTAAKEGHLPVKCAHENCGRSLSAREFQSIASLQKSEDRRRLVRFLLESFVTRHMASLRMCPDRNCQGMGFFDVSSQAMSCLWCRPMEWFCQYCGLKPHPGEMCGAWFDLSEWSARNPVKRKNCPKCTAVILKNGGCNRMHCAYCHAIFFWR